MTFDNVSMLRVGELGIGNWELGAGRQAGRQDGWKGTDR
jgi:hypothetical protein